MGPASGIGSDSDPGAIPGPGGSSGFGVTFGAGVHDSDSPGGGSDGPGWITIADPDSGTTTPGVPSGVVGPTTTVAGDGTSGGGPTTGRAGGPADAGGGASREFTAALAALGLDGGIFSDLSGVQVAVTTSGAVAVWMGFLAFGKRRRDEQAPESDEALAAGAARAETKASSSALLPPQGGAPASSDPEFGIPRWRRQSLLEARRADPRREPITSLPRQTFARSMAAPEADRDRRLIRYRVVRLLDAPDEFRATEIGVLDQGDEVELLERSGVYWLVRCPDGGQGWIHKMTLGDTVGDEPSPTAAQAWAGRRSDASDTQSEGGLIGSFITGRSGA